MAKRRNPKLKSVVALVEVEEPTVNAGVQVAPGVTVEGEAPADPVAERPAIAGALPLVEPSAAIEAAAAAPQVASDETLAVMPHAETEQAVAMEAQPADAAIVELAALADAAASVELATERAPAEIIVAPALAEVAEVEPMTTPPAAVIAAEPAPDGDSLGAGESTAPSSRRDAEAPIQVTPPLVPATVVQAARNREFLARAATVALAAALGVIVGSLTTSALIPATEAVKSANAQPDVPRATVASVDRLAAEVATLKAALAANAAMAPAGSSAGNADGLSRDIAVLKASFGESEVGANTRLLELVAQVNRVERAETDLATRLARIEKPAAKPDVSPEITGSVAPANPPVATGWVLWRVYDGRAVVQGRRGVFDVVPGADLPDLGVVREITQKDGRWVVITQNGVIVQATRRRLG